jgi:hypothetical protein
MWNFLIKEASVNIGKVSFFNIISIILVHYNNWHMQCNINLCFHTAESTETGYF